MIATYDITRATTNMNSTPSTPFNICVDMINLLDDVTTSDGKKFFDCPGHEISPLRYIAEHRILDIYCKSGNFLEAAYYRFMGALRYKIQNPEMRSRYILSNLLYGVGSVEKSPENVEFIVDDDNCDKVISQISNIVISEKDKKPEKLTKGSIKDETAACKNTRVTVTLSKHTTEFVSKIRAKLEELSKVGQISSVMYNYSNGVNPNALNLIRKKFYGKSEINGNIYSSYEGLERTRGNMNFAVVVGNPPYNPGDIYLNFVTKTYDMSTNYVLMITPAKLQMVDTNSTSYTNKDFKPFTEKGLVKHISHICYYPNAYDLFDAEVNSGVAYFLMDKHEHDKAIVKNIWTSFPEVYNNIVCERSISNGETLINVGNNLINDCNIQGGFSYKKTKTPTMKYCVWGTHVAPGYLHYKKGDNTPHFMTSDLKISTSHNVEKHMSQHNFIYFESDSVDECKSFISYTYTKFFRYLVSLKIYLFAIWDDSNTFKFVPAPTVLDSKGNRVRGKFDHIYTDEELFNTFKVPTKYQNIINAVIKERTKIPDLTD